MKEWRRRLLSTSFLSVYDLVFQYTGSWDDSYYTSDDNVEYRLLTLKTDGTLTFDPAMLNRFYFDMWVIAGGGKGSAGKDATIGTYDENESFATIGSSGARYHPSTECGGSAAYIGSGNRGNDGGNGGWSQVNGFISTSRNASVNSGRGDNSVTINNTVILSASVGGDATSSKDGTDGLRTGAQWFSTSYGNGGAGGKGGTIWACNCGYSQGNSPGEGSVGASGVVYIRIPTNQ